MNFQLFLRLPMYTQNYTCKILVIYVQPGFRFLSVVGDFFQKDLFFELISVCNGFFLHRPD